MPNSAPQPASPQTGFSAIRIATVAGIPIRLHFTFLLFLLWVGLAGPHGAGGLSVLYVLAVFLCVVLHELGHSVVALRYGIPVLDITLYPIGGVARIEKRPTARQELGIAVAGPAVNVVIALLLWGVLVALKVPFNFTEVPAQSLPMFLIRLFSANVMLVLFNLIPAFPMDGGRVLRAILAMNMPPEKATGIAANIGQMLAIIAGIGAVFHQPPIWWLMFIAFFIYLGAGQEAFAYRQVALGEGVPVRKAMMTDVRTLTVGSTLKEAADVLLDTAQQDFPVVLGDQVQGLLTRDGLLRGLAGQGPSAYVAGAMFRQYPTVGPDDDLGETLPVLQAASGPLLVMDPAQEGRMLGMITSENVQEYFAVKQIVAARTGANGNGRNENDRDGNDRNERT